MHTHLRRIILCVCALVQASLALTMFGFARLDVNHPKLSAAFYKACERRLDRALQLDNPLQRTAGRAKDLFDLQALAIILQTLAMCPHSSDSVNPHTLTLTHTYRHT